MSSIDERVVEMKFDNDQFQKGVKDTIQALEDLKQSLDLDASARSLADLDAAGRNFDLSGMGDAIDNISSKFSAMGAIGFSILNNLTTKALDIGAGVLNTVLEPIIQGGEKRALNIEQAKFQFEGLGMNVEKSMASALKAVKGTAFGLDEAAVTAAQFGASGMKAGKEMTASLRGIAGVAALSGSSFGDISDVFTKVAGQGRLMGDDLNRLASRGVNAAATMGKAMGKTEAEVRDMVSKGKISFREFANVMNDAFGEHATEASKTYTGALANMRAALARIGADFAATKFESLRKIFNALTPAIDAIHVALEPVLKMFNSIMKVRVTNLVAFIDRITHSLEGKDFKNIFADIAAGFGNIYEAVMAYIEPIKEAFQTIFPPKSLKSIQAMTSEFMRLTGFLMPSAPTLEKIGNIFKGVFAIFDIGWQIVKGLAGVIGDLFQEIFKGSGALLDIGSDLGLWLVNVDKAIKNGTALTKFFNFLSTVLRAPIQLLRWITTGIAAFIEALKSVDFPDITKGFTDFFKKVQTRMKPAAKTFDILGAVVHGAAVVFQKAWDIIKPVAQWIGRAFAQLGSAISESLSTNNFDNLLDVLNTGLLGGLVLFFKKFVDMLKGGPLGTGELDLTGGLLSSIKEAFGGLTGVLEAMQAKIKADALFKIAAAIGIMTASVVALSLIDSAKLASALSGLTIMMGQMAGMMYIMNNIKFDKGASAKMIVMSGALIALGTAMLILAAAAKVFSTMDWNELAKGLVGVAGSLTILITALKLMPSDTSGIVKTSITLGILSTSLLILAGAVKIFASMSWDDIGRSMTALAGSLAILMGAMRLMGKDVVGAGSMLVIATSLAIISGAFKVFSSMSWDDIGRSIVVFAGAVGILVGALAILSALPASPLGAGSMLVMAAAINLLVPPMVAFSKLSWEGIGKAMVVLAGGLAILAGALYLMTASLPGAAALAVAAVGLIAFGTAMLLIAKLSWDDIGRGLTVLAASLLILAVGLTAMLVALPGASALVVAAKGLLLLAPALLALGSLEWGTIGTALGAMAAALGILAVAGIALLPAIPGLLGLGAAIALLGVGVMAAGLGLSAFAVGLTAMVAAGAAGVSMFMTYAESLISLIPSFMEAIGEGIIAIANVIAESGPEMTDAISAMISSLLDAIDENGPKLIDTMTDLIVALVEAIVVLVPEFVDAGMRLLIGVINGIGDNIGKLTDAAVNLVVNFVNALGSKKNIDKVLKAGGDVVLNFINGITNWIDANGQKFITAGSRLFHAVVNGISSAIEQGGADIRWAGERIGNALLNGAMSALGINSPSKEFYKVAGYSIAGLVKGTDQNTAKVGHAGEAIGGALLNGTKRVLDINSPSREFQALGKFVVDGFVNGVLGRSKQLDRVTSTFNDLKDKIKASMTSSKAAMKKASDAIKKAQSSRKESEKELAQTRKALATAKKEGKSTTSLENKIKSLTKSRAKDNATIRQGKKDLAAATSENRKANAAYTELTTKQIKNRNELKKLTKQQATYADKLDAANKALEDATKTRDDYNNSIKDQYSKLGDINQDTTLEGYISDLQKNISDIQELSTNLQTLRSMGLNDTLYKELLSKGTNALPFVNQLLNAGYGGVDQLNDLSNQLTDEATALGSNASAELYQAGVNAAQGIVDGLQSKYDAITKQMDKIADAMVKAIKKKLGIHSPSKEMAKLGAFSGDGLAKGLMDSSSAITNASEQVAADALETMRKSMSELKNAVISDIDIQPTIRPVMDLSDIQKNAPLINDMLSPKTLDVDSTYASALSASSAYQARMASEQAAQDAQVKKEINFYQTNNSPKALSASELYRRTKNQLSVAKEELTSNASTS